MGDEMTGLGFGRGWELLQTRDNTRVIRDEGPVWFMPTNAVDDAVTPETRR